MLAPRSFLFTRNPSSPSSKANSTSKSSSRSSSTIGTRDEDYEAPKSPKNTSPTPSSLFARPSTMTATFCKSATSEPVVIPARSSHRASPRDGRMSEKNESRSGSRKHSDSSLAHRARDIHSPDAIPPSVAALLAMTAIPQRKRSVNRKKPAPSQRLTVDAILQHTRTTEKEYILSLGRSPLDLLLTPPEELDHQQMLDSETGMESYLSTRTLSLESVPSLENDSVGDSSLSLPSLLTPRRKSTLSSRRRQQSVSSPPRESAAEHPLSDPIDVDELDFRIFKSKQEQVDLNSLTEVTTVTQRRKSAFKSNLTASLKALRSAALSLSNMATPMLTPDDFLTRSIISIDPRVPFTDERMPPMLVDAPTPALRRYLNPTTNAPIEAQISSTLAQATRTKCTASIQMQTYKTSKSTKPTPPVVSNRRALPNTPESTFVEDSVGPLARQRDFRENSDFIRVAVMEMAMRKNGKLDERAPGRAKWALPPRKPSTTPYKIGEGGVPVRWIAVSA